MRVPPDAAAAARQPALGRRGAGAEQHVRGAAAGPEAGSGGPAGGPRGQPAVLGLVVAAAAGDALAEDRRHGGRLLGHDGAAEGVGQRQTQGAVLGPGPRLLGHLRGLRAVQEPRPGTQTRHRRPLPRD